MAKPSLFRLPVAAFNAWITRSHRDNAIRRPALVLFWLALAISSVLFLIELAPSTHGWPYWDKVQHLMVFILLGGLAQLAYPAKSWVTPLGLAGYGLGIEWLQGVLTITRVPSLYDWLADVAGLLVSVTLVYLLRQRTTWNG